MPTQDIILCYTDESNVSSRKGEISIRFPTPIQLGSNGGSLSLMKLLVSHATKGPLWVSADIGSAAVLSDGVYQDTLGLFYCDGGKHKTYTFAGSDIKLPLKSPNISSLTLRFYNPLTNTPIEFHKSTQPQIVAHVQIVTQ